MLIRAGIFPSHPDFEDYLQELRLMLFERARRYPDEGIFRNENEVNYLFGFLLWRVIDLQRKVIVKTTDSSNRIRAGRND